MYAISPLRYPGAKWRLASLAGEALRENQLNGGHYAEAYAGGASLALSLLATGHVTEVHLNDLDRSVYAFWKSATEDSEALVDMVRGARLDMETWHEQKALQTRKATAPLLALGFSTFYLNRTNRSGILTAGVIGGKEQIGRWKMDARFNKDDLIERLKCIRAYRSRIHVTRLDAAEFIERRNANLPRKSLLYLDPPYFEKGQDLYLNAYGPDDHTEVARVLLACNRIPWILTYDDVPAIRQLYKSCSQQKFTLRYSASTTRSGREVLFTSPGLRIDKNLLRSV